MNLQVITTPDGWVLDKYAHILSDGLGGVVREHPEPMGADGITYLMNYAQIRKLRSGVEYGRVVSMLTHREQHENMTLLGLWATACEKSDALVPMSGATAGQISEPYRHKATTIQLPVRDCFTKRRPRIGVAACRNPGNEYRKGWDLVDRLRAEHPEWEISVTGGELSDAELVEWYRSLDLYLCPSRYEGGPMGVAEADAMGVPIVAPRGVGWCDEVYMRSFEAGSYDEMERRVRFSIPSTYGGGISARQYIAFHRELFASLRP